jgi:3-deoxy-D-manno-octulosonate 8-phosphate phosphatase (KDO 8-P phosphatase)
MKENSLEVIDSAKGIKALLFDVDGVLTDGKITYTNSGDEIKAFNVKDGQIIKHLKEAGIIVGAITGRSSELVKRRCAELKLDFCFQGAHDKPVIFDQVCEQYGLQKNQVAYIGDDIIDLGILSQCGLAVAPADAMSYVIDHVDLVSQKKGGEGVVREVGDLILRSQERLDGIVNSYLKR